MSNLVSVPKNGSLSSNKSNVNFPSWSFWLDDLFNHSLSPFSNLTINSGINMPKVNVKESDDAFNVEMAAPGMKKSDFQINLTNQILTISSEMQQENEEKEENYTRREFGYTSFNRTFTLPDSVDAEKIDARYEDGILKLTLPKKEEAKPKPPKRIKIS